MASQSICNAVATASQSPPMGLFKPLAAIATGILLIVALHWHVPYLNGPSFFPWPYRDLPGGRIYAAMIIASLPLAAAQFAFVKWPRWVALWLVLMMTSCFSMKLASVAFRDDVVDAATPNLQLIPIIVKDASTTSYFTDAQWLGTLPLRDWLALYPSVMYRTHLHTATKPPGPVIYWYFWIQQLGLQDIDRTARIGGLVLGAIATLSIPATYLFLLALLRRRRAAFCGASFLSLCPGFIQFFPMMDPTYILLSTAVVGCWFVALQKDRIKFAIACGAMLGLAGIITFNLLVIGLFMAGLILIGRCSWRQKILLAGKHGLIVLVTAAIVLVLLRAILNYDVIDTFRHAWANQHYALQLHAETRQYPATIPFDLIDFALGSGFLSVLLCVFYLARHGGGRCDALTWMAIGQFLIVAVTGLLQLETSRVWDFMLPLLMIPVGLELARWPGAWRLVPLATMVLINAAVVQHIKWLY